MNSTNEKNNLADDSAVESNTVWPAAFLTEPSVRKGMKRPNGGPSSSVDRAPKFARQSNHALTPSGRMFKSMCRPNSICTALSEFNVKQREAIVEIGFGGLLAMKIHKTPLDLYAWLIDAFNPKSGIVSVNGRSVFQVSKHDVRDIFLLPNGSVPIKESDRAESTQLRRELFEKYDLLTAKKNKDKKKTEKDVLTLERVMAVMKTLKEGCDDFKRFFVMYVVSCFLVPTANRNIRPGILGVVQDVGEIPKMDWCKYVMDHLCLAIEEWKQGTTQTHLGGCLMVLQSCYLQRHPWWGEELPKELPLIQNLDEGQVKERIEGELGSGGFGLGIFHVDGYPVSKKLCGNAGSHRVINWEVDDDLLMDSDIEQLYPDEFHASLTKARRDLELFKRRNISRLMHNGVSESCSRDALSFTQDIDEMVDSLQKLKSLVYKRNCSLVVSNQNPSALTDNLQSDNVEQCAFSNGSPHHGLLDNEEGECYVNNLEDLLLTNPVADSDWVGEYVVHQAKEHYLDSGPSSPKDAEQSNPELSQIVDSLNSELLDPVCTRGSSESERTSRFDEVLEELTSMDDVHFKSKLLAEYPTSMRCLKKHDALISDFCIARHQKLSSSYVIYSNGESCRADASDFTSLELGSYVSTSIINAYATTMNSRPVKPSKPLMVCLDVIPNYGPLIAECVLFTLWDESLKNFMRNFLSASMVLIPVLVNEHFFAVVVNMKSSKIQYIDSMTHVQTIDEWMAHVVSLRKLASDYMFSKGHHKAGEVAQYPIETVGGSWRSDTGNGDCGVYVMHHMRYFRGEESLDGDFLQVLNRNAFRAKVCAHIVRSRNNTRALNVIEDVLEYHKISK